MLYEIDEREYRLSAGDTLHFPASLPHRARNIGPGEARELWVARRGSFQIARLLRGDVSFGKAARKPLTSGRDKL